MRVLIRLTAPRRPAAAALYEDYAAPGLLSTKEVNIGRRYWVKVRCRLTLGSALISNAAFSEGKGALNQAVPQFVSKPSTRVQVVRQY